MVVYSTLLAEPLAGSAYNLLTYSQEDIEQAMRCVLRDPAAKFRSQQQEEAVKAVLRRESPLVVVLPTGGGKSLVFMLPASLSQSGVTIVVAPFKALVDNLVERCKLADINCILWQPGEVSQARVVVVGAERAVGEEFMTYASGLAAQGLLQRVVIDECYLTFTASSYCNHLMHLKRL